MTDTPSRSPASGELSRRTLVRGALAMVAGAALPSVARATPYEDDSLRRVVEDFPNLVLRSGNSLFELRPEGDHYVLVFRSRVEAPPGDPVVALAALPAALGRSHSPPEPSAARRSPPLPQTAPRPSPRPRRRRSEERSA